MIQEILEIINIAGSFIVSPGKGFPHGLGTDGGKANALSRAL